MRSGIAATRCWKSSTMSQTSRSPAVSRSSRRMRGLDETGRRRGSRHDTREQRRGGREDPTEALQLLNSRIKLIYAADSGLDEFRHDPVGAGAVRFDDISGALRAFGYRGDTVLEILTDEPDRALASSVAQLETHAWPRRDES